MAGWKPTPRLLQLGFQLAIDGPLEGVQLFGPEAQGAGLGERLAGGLFIAQTQFDLRLSEISARGRSPEERPRQIVGRQAGVPLQQVDRATAIEETGIRAGD